MALDLKGECIGYNTDEDLSDNQFRVVILKDEGIVGKPTAGTDMVLGVQQNDTTGGPNPNEVSVCISGLSKIELGDTVVAGEELSYDFATEGDFARAKPATTGDVIIGSAQEGGDVGDLGVILLNDAKIVKA